MHTPMNPLARTLVREAEAVNQVVNHRSTNTFKRNGPPYAVVGVF